MAGQRVETSFQLDFPARPRWAMQLRATKELLAALVDNAKSGAHEATIKFSKSKAAGDHSIQVGDALFQLCESCREEDNHWGLCTLSSDWSKAEADEVGIIKLKCDTKRTNSQLEATATTRVSRPPRPDIQARIASAAVPPHSIDLPSSAASVPELGTSLSPVKSIQSQDLRNIQVDEPLARLPSAGAAAVDDLLKPKKGPPLPKDSSGNDITAEQSERATRKAAEQGKLRACIMALLCARTVRYREKVPQNIAAIYHAAKQDGKRIEQQKNVIVDIVKEVAQNCGPAGLKLNPEYRVEYGTRVYPEIMAGPSHSSDSLPPLHSNGPQQNGAAKAAAAAASLAPTKAAAKQVKAPADSKPAVKNSLKRPSTLVGAAPEKRKSSSKKAKRQHKEAESADKDAAKARPSTSAASKVTKSPQASPTPEPLPALPKLADPPPAKPPLAPASSRDDDDDDFDLEEKEPPMSTFVAPPVAAAPSHSAAADARSSADVARFRQRRARGPVDYKDHDSDDDAADVLGISTSQMAASPPPVASSPFVFMDDERSRPSPAERSTPSPQAPSPGAQHDYVGSVVERLPTLDYHELANAPNYGRHAVAQSGGPSDEDREWLQEALQLTPQSAASSGVEALERAQETYEQLQRIVGERRHRLAEIVARVDAARVAGNIRDVYELQVELDNVYRAQAGQLQLYVKALLSLHETLAWIRSQLPPKNGVSH